jgi:hypothetical protein
MSFDLTFSVQHRRRRNEIQHQPLVRHVFRLAGWMSCSHQLAPERALRRAFVADCSGAVFFFACMWASVS